MVQPLKQKKRQQILIMALVVVVIITILVWYSNSREAPSGEESISTGGDGTIAGFSASEERLKRIELDLDILDDSLFKSLKSHGVLPVIAGETGRENPFLPY